MAMLMMAHQNKEDKIIEDEKPTFHDFLGMRCASDHSPLVVLPKQNRHSDASASLGGASSGGGHGPVSATSDLGCSERLIANLPEGVPSNGPQSDLSGPEISNRFAGRKRSNSDSIYRGSSRDKMPQIGPDSVESSHLMKLISGSVGGERLKRSHDDDLFFTMQPPRQSSTSALVLQPSVGTRPESVASKWERAIKANLGQIAQYPPRLSQCTTHIDKASSNSYRDGIAGPSVISQPAADEGSRTGIKGSGILSGINASSTVLERSSSKVQLSSRPTSGPQTAEPELSRHGLAYASRQMTIFYSGQAHVFDDVHPNKADVIMALAGSNGGSWSTTYSSKSGVRPSPHGETCLPRGENEGVQQELRGRLSIAGSSSHHGFNTGAQALAAAVDPTSLSSFGSHYGSTIRRETRLTATQSSKPDSTGGKREV